MAKVGNRVKETSATTGTGTLDLAGAPTGFRGFGDEFTSGDSVYYLCVDDPDNPTEYEYGTGTFTSGTPDTLSRDSVEGSSNGGSKVSWIAGCTVISTPTAAALQSAIGGIADGSLTTAKLADNAVTNAKSAQMAANTIKGNNTGGAADADDLTATEATAMLDAVVGDSGSGGTKGLVPAPAAGDAAANKFLKASGGWAAAGTFTGKFTSAQQAITAGGTTITVAHGLGAAPFWAGLILHCVTVDCGYAVGDEVYLTSNGSTLASSDASGFGVYCDATNVNVIVPSNSGLVLANKTGGARTVFTPANWKIIVKAWL